MPGDGRRPKRVAETLRASLTAVIGRDLSDPLLTSLVITDVDMPPDLSFAKVSVRLLVGDEVEANRRAALQHLTRAAGRLRRIVSPRLGLRRAPELRFLYDRGHDAARRVEELLAEIAAEPHARDEEE